MISEWSFEKGKPVMSYNGDEIEATSQMLTTNLFVKSLATYG